MNDDLQHTVRLLAPLNTSAETAEEALAILRAAIEKTSGKR